VNKYYLYDQQLLEHERNVYDEIVMFKNKKNIKKYLIKLHAVDSSIDELKILRKMTLDQICDLLGWSITKEVIHE
jgi:hypothetical protein